MSFTSIINFPFQLLRLLFVFACLTVLALIVGLYRPIQDISFIPWYAKLIIAIGVLYGSIFTLLGLFRGMNKLSIRHDIIYIKHLLTFKKKYYSLDEIEKIREHEYYDSRLTFNGMEIKFRNGDKYDFVSYNYLNYKKLKEHLLTLKKKLR